MATRWACLGPGKIASDFFTSIVSNLPAEDHEFVAVASTSRERAEAFAEKFKFKRAYDCYDDVAKDADVDLVYICNMHIDHAPLSIKMLEAGKHVLCEKPMALNERQVNEVFDVAKKNNRFFSEGMWSRHNPMYQVVRDELNKKSIGNIWFVEAKLAFPVPNDLPIFTDIENGAGGALLLGVYPVQFATLVFNEMPEQIKAVGALGEGGIDERAAIALRYKSGAVASLYYDTKASVGQNRGIIIGDEGFIEVGDVFIWPEKVTTPSKVYEQPLKKGTYLYPGSDALHYEANGVRNSILEGKLENPVWTRADTTLMYRILDEIRRQIGIKYAGVDD